jgi:hypothetical protein
LKKVFAKKLTVNADFRILQLVHVHPKPTDVKQKKKFRGYGILPGIVRLIKNGQTILGRANKEILVIITVLMRLETPKILCWLHLEFQPKRFLLLKILQTKKFPIKIALPISLYLKFLAIMVTLLLFPVLLASLDLLNIFLFMVNRTI